MNYRAMMFRDRHRSEHWIDSAMFVDPGLGGTGWAYFQAINTAAKKVVLPISSGVIKIQRPKGEDAWVSHAAMVSSSFQGVLAAHRPRIVVFEQPALWSGDAESYAATIKGKDGEPGSLFKLANLIGQFGLLTKQVLGVLPVYIHPDEWKGMLSKELVLKRIARHGLEPEDHEGDAIGMGFAAQGKL